MPWVKFHEELCKGSKRDLSRATRFVYLEICLEARRVLDIRDDGSAWIPISGKGSIVQAIRDLIGGSAMEIRHAMDVLTSGSDPMLLVVGDDPGAPPEGDHEATQGGARPGLAQRSVGARPGLAQRSLVVRSYLRWNKVDDSSRRAKKYREGKRGLAGIVTRDDDDGDDDNTLPEEIRGDQMREEDPPPPTRARPKGGRPPPPLPEGTSPEVAAVVEELRKHPVVCRASTTATRGAQAAALELAGAIEGRRLAKGTPIAKVIEAIGEAACILAAECAGGETPQWPAVATMIMRYVIQVGVPRGGGKGGVKGQGRPLDRSTSQSAGKAWKVLPQGLTRAEMTAEERATFDAMPEEKRLEYMRLVAPGDPAP